MHCNGALIHRTRRFARSLLLTRVLYGAVVLFVAASAAQAKPQIDGNADSVGDVYLYYDTYNANEGSWNNFITVDQYKPDGTEDSGYPQEDLTPYQTTAYGAQGAVTHQYAINQTLGYTAVYIVSGEWNGVTFGYTERGIISPCPPLYYDPCCRRWMSWCSYTHCDTLVTAATWKSVDPASLPWKAHVLGVQSLSATSKAIYVDLANSDLASDANIRLAYTVLTKTTLDGEPVYPPAANETNHITVVPVNGHRVNFVHTANNISVYNVAHATQQSAAAPVVPNAMTVKDLVIDITGLTGNMFVDIFAVNTTPGHIVSIPLKRVQVCK